MIVVESFVVYFFLVDIYGRGTVGGMGVVFFGYIVLFCRGGKFKFFSVIFL